MQNTARAALAQLIEGDSIMIGGVAKHRDPLIGLLRESATSSTGGGGGSGSGGDRSVINLAAFELYETIDGYARAHLDAWKLPTRGLLEDVLQRMFDAIPAEIAVWMTADQADEVYARFGQWVRKIEDLFDPPHTKEFPGACPNEECGETHHEKDGVSNLALAAVIRPGWAVIVECRACGSMWQGQESLTALAEHIGAEIDWATLLEINSC